ncbi:LysR family transcriptional regulator [Aliiroseovarius zhejiangensis]|uniref:LysR family transcriptional regulator n=1 Tax=Aliiroseovarius zhejiangensis TaxID=1632025 RepID=A0ABQ3JAM8_9RHOB|nr:LysR substrate-binding domain-containing protein [Aliiroseovarius zhejiangensis]GHF07426.1 LysR family transcriptional regulator [Aliiroseovarius zhejiangensis]
MRHSQLKAFHHVALLGGFSRAAEALYLTQPAISEQVKKLEQDHDTLLFHRERKRVRLTEEGAQLFLYTKQYFEIEQQIEDYMSATSAAIDGELRIIADSAHHITHFLGDFRKRYPDISVTLRTGNTEEILEDLRAYNAEIGIVGSLTPGNDMEALNLSTTKITAFAARGSSLAKRRSLSLQDLADLPLIFREQGSKTRQKLEERAKKKGLTLTPAIVAEGREAVREVVASGAGIGFVSLAEYGHDDRLVQIQLVDADIEMSETLVHLAQRRDVKVIRAFMEFARNAQQEKSAGGLAGAS